ncbi:hypothetical protein P1N98_12005, partial [Tsukamurella tyrosinosolvens]
IACVKLSSMSTVPGRAALVAPAAAARRTAERIAGPAEVLDYPIDHFDGYTGPMRDEVLADEVAFLTRVLRPSRR